MRKRRMQDETYPTDNAGNYCGWDDYRGSWRLRRTGTYPCNARGEQLARDSSILLLLVVLWGQALLVLLRWEEILSALLPALPVPLQLLALPGLQIDKRRALARRLRVSGWVARMAAHHFLPGVS